MKFGEFMKLNKINDVLSNNRVMANEIIKTSDSIEDLFSKVSGLIEQARSYVKTSVNTADWKNVANCSWYIQNPQRCCGFWDNQRMKFPTFFFHGLII